jgi:hypothetical protein
MKSNERACAGIFFIHPSPRPSPSPPSRGSRNPSFRHRSGVACGGDVSRSPTSLHGPITAGRDGRRHRTDRHAASAGARLPPLKRAEHTNLAGGARRRSHAKFCRSLSNSRNALRSTASMNMGTGNTVSGGARHARGRGLRGRGLCHGECGTHLAVDDGRAGLVVLLLGDPHLLEGGERGEDGATDCEHVRVGGQESQRKRQQAEQAARVRERGREGNSRRGAARTYSTRSTCARGAR